MKYKYYDKGNRLIAESESPIQFNVARFPIWKSITPVVEEEVKEASRPKSKKKKKTEIVEDTTTTQEENKEDES